MPQNLHKTDLAQQGRVVSINCAPTQRTRQCAVQKKQNKLADLVIPFVSQNIDENTLKSKENAIQTKVLGEIVKKPTLGVLRTWVFLRFHNKRGVVQQ